MLSCGINPARAGRTVMCCLIMKKWQARRITRLWIRINLLKVILTLTNISPASTKKLNYKFAMSGFIFNASDRASAHLNHMLCVKAAAKYLLCASSIVLEHDTISRHSGRKDRSVRLFAAPSRLVLPHTFALSIISAGSSPVTAALFKFNKKPRPPAIKAEPRFSGFTDAA